MGVIRECQVSIGSLGGSCQVSKGHNRESQVKYRGQVRVSIGCEGMQISTVHDWGGGLRVIQRGGAG